MTRWTLEDKQHFQRLRRALAGCLQDQLKGRLTKADIEDLARAYKLALKAVYPTDDAEQLATMRQWMRLIESYADSPDDGRRLHLAALSFLQAKVADVLGPCPDPAVETAVINAEADIAQRRPYYLDRDD